MEAETSLVGTDSAVELDTVSQVGLDLTVVVNPGNAESEDPVGLYDSLDDLCLFELRMLVVDILDGLKNLLNRLEIFLLCRVLGLETGHYFCGFHNE